MSRAFGSTGRLSRRAGRGRVAQSTQDLSGDAGLEGRLAPARRSNGFGQGVGADVFEKVTRGARLERLKDQLVVVVGGEDEDRSVRPARRDPPLGC